MRVGRPFLVMLSLGLAADTARGSSPTTCAYEKGGAATVQVDGRATTIESTPAGIFVNGIFCGEPDWVETVYVYGSSLPDRVTLSGQFVPGYSVEADWDELEVVVDLAGGSDIVTVSLGDGADRVELHPAPAGLLGASLRLNSDVDNDVQLGGVETIKVMGNGGDDELRADLYSGGSKVYLYGGTGNDFLIGSPARDWLYGEDGGDVMFGGGGNDDLDGGAGGDVGIGDAGNDRFLQGAAADSYDYFEGGTGVDTFDYGLRTNPLSVTVGNGFSDDGEAGEFDAVQPDVEKVVGGGGNDVIVGTASANTLIGGPGDDSLYGAGGVDTLYGGDGADHLVGDAGGDKLWGDAGDDTLDGGAGNDSLRGGDGADVLDGGGGTDAYFGEAGDDLLYNDDGVAETVDCGPGLDDPENDLGATDAFIDCELI